MAVADGLFYDECGAYCGVGVVIAALIVVVLTMSWGSGGIHFFKKKAKQGWMMFD